ncbi:MAG TPA: PAS domain S-box protein [Planctomycetota bacterium]|nr:PAS domain S-box protein [Planctomycetota bacterium]
MASEPAFPLHDALQAALRKTSLSPVEQATVFKAMLPYSHAYEGFEHLLDLSKDLMCMARDDGFFTWVNAAFERVLGYSKEELLSRQFFAFVHPDDVEITKVKLEKLKGGLDVVHFENRYRSKDGGWRRLAWVCPAATPGSKVLYAVARDVTEEHGRERPKEETP